MAAKPTRRGKFNVLLRRTRHLVTAPGSPNVMAIANQLTILRKHIDRLTSADIETIEQLMLLCYEEGKFIGAQSGRADRTCSATAACQQPAQSDAQPFGGRADYAERGIDNADPGGDSSGADLFHHGHRVGGSE